MKHLPRLLRACASLLKPLAVVSALASAPAAMAQPEFKYGYTAPFSFQDIVDDLIKACRDDVETFITRTLAAPDYNGNGMGYGTLTPQQADLDKDGSFNRKDPVAIINSEMIMWLVDIRSPSGVATIRQSLAYKESTLTGAGYVDGNAIHTVAARLNLIRCLYNHRIKQLQGTTLVGDKPSAGAAAATPAPAAQAGNTALPYPNSKLGSETQKALADILDPNPRAGQSFFNGTDFGALAEGRPSNAAAKQDHAKAGANYAATKTRKLHNRANDVTPCLAVDPTGVREEWGIEGRYRIRNTCSFPVEAAWCANKKECSTGRGNRWTIGPKKTWPIYFADIANPEIGIGGCRTEDKRAALPSDAAISAAGGIQTAHKSPMPFPGVTIMPGHRCE